MPTVLHRLARWADESPEAPAQTYLKLSEGSRRQGDWTAVSAKEMRDRTYHLALFLESRGMKPGDVSVIFSFNNPEWVQMDLAPGLIGGLSAGIYPNSTHKDINYIIEHTGAKVLGVQNAAYFNKMIDMTGGEDSLPKSVELIIVFDGSESISRKAISYEKAIAEGKKLAKGKKFKDYLGRVNKDAPAFIIYTSGTTGHPKGAVLSHDNLAFTSDVAISYWGIPVGGRLFSFLPLCHVAEKMQGIGVAITNRYNVYYASKFENVSRELPQARPTLLLSVPRLWEKMMEGAKLKIKEAPPLKQQLMEWALGVGERVSNARYNGRFPAIKDLLQYPVANKLVLSKIREAMGLGDCSRAASGAAALPALVARWFRSIGLEILEDYGQTESTGVICMTVPGVDCAGTVGKPVPGTDFKLAEDGEILTKGRHVFLGYFKNEQATKDTVVDGWLKTGDLGEFTDRGLLRIKGRKKEILKTSGGKMVAPTPIEDRLKESSIISQACMVGDGRKYLTVLVTIPDTLSKDLQTKEGAIEGVVIRDSEILSLVKRQIDDINATLASYEKIKQFRVLSHEFSIDSGELTPTMKMKRAVIEKKYEDVVNQMYSTAGAD